ncbi:MAG: TonB-dependent receptor plug domain-containing protein [Saprospiraceae bacterium]|nr:TonB-dependent receptor plug domain-containing protein [Saprospiraceae bacterium]
MNLSDAFTLLEKERKLHIAFDPIACKNYLVFKWDSQQSNASILDNLLRATPFRFKPQEKNHYLIYSDPIKLQELSLSQSSLTSIECSGIIIDHTTGEFLPGAIVIVMPESFAIVSDQKGNFSLQHKTSYPNPWIEIRYLGYQTQVIHSFKDKKNFQIKLVQNYSQLPDVEIQAIRPQLNLNKVKTFPSHLNFTPAIQLSKNAFNDPLRSLQQLPGINATEDKNVGLQIRGSNVEENLILLNGLMLFSVDHFYGVFSNINPYIVSEINVYKSYFPSTFGGRSSSVINILSPAANQEFHGGIDINMITANAYAYIPLGKRINVLGAFRTTTFDLGENSTFNQIVRNKKNNDLRNRELNFDLTAINPDYSFHDYYLKGDYKISRSITASASYFKSFDKILTKYASSFNGNQNGRYADTSSWNSRGYIAGLKGSYSNNLNFELSYSRSEYEFNYMNNSGVRDLNTAYLENSQVLNSAFNNNIKFLNKINGVNSTIEAGIEFNQFRSNVKMNFNSFAIVSEDKVGNEISPFIHAQFKLSEYFKYSPGFRLIFFNQKSTPDFSPRLSLEYNSKKGFTSTLNAGRYFQYLRQGRYEDRFGREFYLWTQADKNAVPVLSSNQFELINQYKFNNSIIKTELYFKSLQGLFENLIFVDTGRSVNPKKIFREVINGRGRSYGLDLSFEQIYKYYSFNIIYSYNKSENSFPEINNEQYYQKPYVRSHQFKFIQQVKFNKFTFSCIAVYGSPLPYYDVIILTKSTSINRNPNLDIKELDDYFRIDSDLRYNIPIKKSRLEISCSILNILDRENAKFIQTLFRLADAKPGNPQIQTIGAEVNNLRRTINFGIGYHF